MRRHNWIPRPVKERELPLKHNVSAPQQERGPCTQRQRAQTSSRRNHQVTLGTSIHKPPGLPLQMKQQHAVRWGLPLHPVPNVEECQTTPALTMGPPHLTGHTALRHSSGAVGNSGHMKRHHGKAETEDFQPQLCSFQFPKDDTKSCSTLLTASLRLTSLSHGCWAGKVLSPVITMWGQGKVEGLPSPNKSPCVSLGYI